MTGVVRLDPSAVTSSPRLVEGPALTRTASLFEPGDGLSAGIWEAEPFTEQIPAYPCDEVCVVLEGTIHLRMPDAVRMPSGPVKRSGSRREPSARGTRTTVCASST